MIKDERRKEIESLIDQALKAASIALVENNVGKALDAVQIVERLNNHLVVLR